MSDGAIHQAANGELQLVGVLDYRTGPALREVGRQLIQASTQASLVLDCALVEKSSSVGLSLLLAFLRDAKAADKPLSIRQLPADMLEIAKVSGLLEVLAPQA
ncbi:STAS domain-containing protein [Pseudomonas sp. J452]|uniref:STAS domain-containing protein n=1 Tax=Pseudomonas sp. J452 TaxID=2898441 RepID=UPI0021ADAEAE|nr:STAS domain-containing protein [Pseudomonas sp. J452]UUY10402.1 STAS domain-containing protein [Pseudomonas sp. J452]